MTLETGSRLLDRTGDIDCGMGYALSTIDTGQ